jgi:GATA zinc finger
MITTPVEEQDVPETVELPPPTQPVGSGQRMGKVCSNCGTTQASYWRRSPTGHRECNACSIHRQRHNEPRPLALANAYALRRRNRVRPAPEGETGQ